VNDKPKFINQQAKQQSTNKPLRRITMPFVNTLPHWIQQAS